MMMVHKMRSEVIIKFRDHAVDEVKFVIDSRSMQLFSIMARSLVWFVATLLQLSLASGFFFVFSPLDLFKFNQHHLFPKIEARPQYSPIYASQYPPHGPPPSLVLESQQPSYFGYKDWVNRNEYYFQNPQGYYQAESQHILSPPVPYYTLQSVGPTRPSPPNPIPPIPKEPETPEVGARNEGAEPGGGAEAGGEGEGEGEEEEMRAEVTSPAATTTQAAPTTTTGTAAPTEEDPNAEVEELARFLNEPPK